MDNNIAQTVIKTIDDIVQAVPATTNGIAKIKEIKRTTGISKIQAKRLMRENETNTSIANGFVDFCDKNPGFLYTTKIGNIELSNIGKILEEAQFILKDNSTIPNMELDKEWILKFLDASGKVSDLEKQRILARVLVGQLKKPESISYRTLGILKDLTKKDIELFKKAISCSFKTNTQDHTRFVLRVRDDNYMFFSNIMSLAQCGLMEDSGMKILSVKNKTHMLSSCNNYLLTIEPNDKQSRIEVDCYYFTNSGTELAEIMEIHEAPEEILKIYGNNSKKATFKLSLHRLLSKDGENLSYETADILEQNT